MGPEILPLLRDLPSLTCLVLERCGFKQSDAALLNALIITGAPSDICPNLISLTYGGDLELGSQAADNEDQTLHPRSAETLARVKELQDEGLDVAITNHRERMREPR
ncbi:hypothetical protein C8R47DRAFT_1227575 [Mycena vitilis]|nr:hypothetical protein C8R47DRAFT_1227575 [Mycena vitilis]